MGVGCSPGEKHWVEGLGCPALLVVGNEIFPTNPPLPLSPGQMFNRVTTSMTYEAQVGVCGNSHCLEPRRQVHIQVWRQDIEETRSGICKNKVSGPVLGREIWDLSQVQPWIWWFRDAFVLYVTARKSRAWHRKKFSIYIDWPTRLNIFQLPVGTHHSHLCCPQKKWPCPQVAPGADCQQWE